MEKSLILIGLVAVLALGIFFISQNVTPDQGPVRTPQQRVANSALIRMANFAPTYSKVDTYIDGTKVAGGLPYGGISRYFAIEPGVHSFQVSRINQQENYFAEKEFSMEAKKYTVAITRNTNNQNVILKYSNEFNPRSGLAGLRFINLSADSPPLNFGVSEGPTFAEGVSFQGGTNFISIQPDNYNLAISNANNGEVLLRSENISIEANNNYTVFIIGSYADNNLSSTLLIN